MVLYVWLFECARCHELIVLCTKCIGGRRYCDLCGEEANKESVRECGRRYQSTPKGKENHRARQQRYRDGVRERGQQKAPESPVDGTSTRDSEPAGPGPTPGVTHRYDRQTNDMGVQVHRAPAAAYAVGAGRGDNDAQPPANASISEATTVLAQLRNNKGRPVTATCCCCGRRGEIVAYKGEPRIMRWSPRGREPE